MSSETAVHPLAETLEKSKSLIGEHKYQEAVDLLTEARREKLEGAEPGLVEDLHYSMGLCLNSLDRSNDALPHLRKALRMAEEAKDPGAQARALEQLGSSAYKKNEHQNALALFAKATALWEKAGDKPGQARCLRDIGTIQIDLHQDKEALEALDKSRELFTELEDQDGIVSCVTNMGLVHYRKEGQKAAITLYKEHLENGLEHYLLLNNLGFLEMMDENFGEARTFLERGKKDLDERAAEDDNAALLNLNLGILEALEDKHDSALKLLDRADELFERFPEGRAVELMLQVNDKYRDKGFLPFLVAEDAHKRAITRLNRAAVLQKKGESDKALEEAQTGVEMDRNQPYPYLCLGWIHLARGEEDDAVRAFKRATGMEPGNELYRQALELVNPHINAKVGRNDPCPCGSGKKFKKCHGRV